MNESPDTELPPSPNDEETRGRRNFLQSMGKWSGAAITAAVAGSWLGSGTESQASWINRRGGWVNRSGGGGWINRGGGGGWVNRGGGGWINRRY